MILHRETNFDRLNLSSVGNILLIFSHLKTSFVVK